jgi:cellulose biosynthesis protein BcsS
MRCGGRIAAACVAAVCGFACFSAWAETNDVVPAAPSADDVLLAQPTYLLFSSTDLWRHGGFAHGGMLWAPSGLDREGPVLKIMFGGGIYHYTSGALGGADVRGETVAASILPGWRFIHGDLTVTTFLGLDLQRHRLTPDDPSAGLRGDYAGARAGFELWYQPTPMTRLTADASVSTVGPSYNARLAGGWRVFDMFYVGPEAAAFAADDNYKQIRAGFHLTGLRIGDFEWSAGLGWALDTDERSGFYGKLGVFTRR